MEERSYLIFIERPKPIGWRCLDDPVYELRALDPELRIRVDVHTGHPDKTGYAIQVFADNDRQNTIIKEYMKLRNIKDCLYIHDDFAHVLDFYTGKTRGYAKANYVEKGNRDVPMGGYKIYLENSRWIGHIMFKILGYVRTKHPELNQIVKGGFVICEGKES